MLYYTEYICIQITYAFIDGIIIDPNDITALPQQYALIDESYTLQCTSIIKGAFISWLQNDELLSFGPLKISSVQLSDEGIYECRVSVIGARTDKPVQLNVIGNQITADW